MISTEDRSPSPGRDDSANLNNNLESSLLHQSAPRESTTTTSPPQQFILRDPPPHHGQLVPVGNANPGVISTQHGISDFIHQAILPKLGSIVKRFSLNYSGEGLVTDRQRTRTVRVGIRFQVQVDSFVNSNQERQRPAIGARRQSAPPLEVDSGFSSPTGDIFNNRQLALEFSKNGRTGSCSSLVASDCGGCGDSESSTPATSPVLARRQSSATLAFHNRINQALNLYRNQLLTSPPSPSSSGDSLLNRRSSVQVYRRGSATPNSNGYASPPHIMEDSSSYQMLRHFPGSNVNSLNELSWETAAFEKEIRDRIHWLGDKMSNIRLPRVISQLVDFGREYARENPVTALILLALCLTSAAPVLLFLVFAVATILVTFLGFLFVEGTLLTGATLIFGGVILVVGFATLSAVLVGMLGYLTTNQAYMVLTGKSNVFKLLRRIPVLGPYFPEPRDEDPEEKSDLPLKSGGAPVANGKVGNGYGPIHGNHTHSNHHQHDEHDYDDLLDTEDEVEEEEDDEDIEVDTSDLGEDDHDLGNQENLKADNHNEASNDTPRSASPLPPVMVNGHHRDSEESENSEDLALHD